MYHDHDRTKAWWCFRGMCWEVGVLLLLMDGAMDGWVYTCVFTAWWHHLSDPIDEST